MKSFLISYLLIILLVFRASATGICYSSKNINYKTLALKETKWMQKELGLNDSVFKPIYHINLNYFKQISEVNADTLDAEFFETIQKLKDQRNNLLKVILSETQYKSYCQLIINRREKIAEGLRENRTPQQFYKR